MVAIIRQFIFDAMSYPPRWGQQPMSAGIEEEIWLFAQYSFYIILLYSIYLLDFLHQAPEQDNQKHFPILQLCSSRPSCKQYHDPPFAHQ